MNETCSPFSLFRLFIPPSVSRSIKCDDENIKMNIVTLPTPQFVFIRELSKSSLCSMSLPSTSCLSASTSHWLPFLRRYKIPRHCFLPRHSSLRTALLDKLGFFGCRLSYRFSLLLLLSLQSLSYAMKSFHLSLAVLLLCVVAWSQAHTPGTVTVDSLTFDKVIRNFDVVLAKFDDKYRTYIPATMNGRSTLDF